MSFIILHVKTHGEELVCAMKFQSFRKGPFSPTSAVADLNNVSCNGTTSQCHGVGLPLYYCSPSCHDSESG